MAIIEIVKHSVLGRWRVVVQLKEKADQRLPPGEQEQAGDGERAGGEQAKLK